MNCKKIFLLIIFVSSVFISCENQENQYTSYTFECDSNVPYSDDIEIYKVFSDRSLSGFDVIKGNFHIGPGYYVSESQITIFNSSEELKELKDHIIDFDIIDDNVGHVFEDNILGMIIVILADAGDSVKNVKIYNKTGKLAVSIDVEEYLGSSAQVVSTVIFFLKIPKN